MFRIKNRGCKFANHYNDWVPMPFGSGNCAMPGFECMYEGELMIDEECDESQSCPAYEPMETKICPKHDEEYIIGEECSSCMEEEDAKWEAAVEQSERINQG